MCHAVNSGIVRAMTEGVVRSTNFLVPCSWFPEAIELARRHELSAGVHLCLTCEWDHMRWRPLTKAPGLCDASGYLLPSFGALEATARDEEMYGEFKAQVECVEKLGFPLTHVDTHMFGSGFEGPFARRVRDVIERVCAEHGLSYTFAVRGSELAHFTGQFGLSGTPPEALWQQLESCGDGVYILTGHAAEPSPELEALCSVGHWGRSWAASYRVADLVWFTSPSTRERLSSLGFELVDARSVLAQK
jgi:hypothetical protein